MKIAIGSDEKNYLTDYVLDELRKMDFEIEPHGPLADKNLEWTDVAEAVATKVSKKECDQGILFCWTGTGVTIAANKVPRIRAALCNDAETARGARKWNDANILTMSLRLITPTVAKEILEAWFSSKPEKEELENIKKVSDIENKYFSNIGDSNEER